MKIGVITSLDNELAADEAGADYVEGIVVGNIIQNIDGQWQLNEAAAKKTYPSFAILFPGDVKISDPAFPESEYQKYINEVAPLLAQVKNGPGKIVFGSGAARTLPSGIERQEAVAVLAQRLKSMHEVFGRHGLEILLEPLNKKECDVINSIAEAFEFLDAHGLSEIRVVADIYHMMLEGESVEIVTRNSSRIGHIHLADTGRKVPGTGDWPITELVKIAIENNITDSLTIEAVYEDFGADLQHGVSHLRDIVGKLV